jgi:16S rRNA processing protein RimM
LGRIDGVSTPDAAAGLNDYRIAVARASLPGLAPGEFYVVDLIGAAAVTATGERIGEVVDLHTTAGGDLVEIRSGTDQHFLALNGPFVLEVDVAARRVVVDPAGWSEE